MTVEKHSKKILLLDPYPRTRELLFSKRDFKRLEEIFNIVQWENGRMPTKMVDKFLPEAFALIGQTDLPAERIKKAKELKAIVNVEGNFQQNIDYNYCFKKGIHVLNAGIAFSEAVAEAALGFALALARGISLTDRLFRSGKETYGRVSNKSSFLLKGKKAGIIGLGNVGRALIKLLEPFRLQIGVYDPWLPENFILGMGCEPLKLEKLLRTSRIIFLLAGATSENRAMIGNKELDLIKKDSLFILVSRAALVDFDSLIHHLKNKSFSAAIDVFPEEPLAKDSKLRSLDNVLLSSHRAGGIPEAYKLMGEMVADDLSLIAKGLPPVRLQKASLETVTKLSSKPVG